MKNIFTLKKILMFVGVILILFIGIVIGSGLNKNNPAPASVSEQPVVKEAVSENNSENKNENNNIVASENSDNKVDSGLVKVVRVIDGDTIEIEGGEHVRYIGIDTPETVDPRKPVQCFGVEASAKNKELVDGKMVRLEKDITDRDKYNRLLRYIFIGDTFINLELVKQGFAYSYSYPPDIKYQDQFVKAQQEAREAKNGLWNACPTNQEQQSTTPAPASVPISIPIPASTPVPTPTQENNSTISCLIKGNINSSGEKIYHLPGCASYSKTQIDESHGEKWFCSESEAQSAGWRKALNCP